jgi:hypothetical protein
VPDLTLVSTTPETGRARQAAAARWGPAEVEGDFHARVSAYPRLPDRVCDIECRVARRTPRRGGMGGTGTEVEKT